MKDNDKRLQDRNKLIDGDLYGLIVARNRNESRNKLVMKKYIEKIHYFDTKRLICGLFYISANVE